MIHKPVFCQFLILCAGLSVVGEGIYAYSATRGEYACHLYILGIHQSYEVLHYYVHAVFVEITVITEAEQIEFKTLALHHFLSRNILYTYLGKVGLPCNWAQRCKLRAVELHPKVVAGMLVVNVSSTSGA